MTNVPLVTVLMPVYNGAEYLKEAVQSILTQTFRNFEFLIIDDGSTDNTANLLAEVQDSRISIYRNKENLGYTRCLKIGVTKAQGQYIARIDADDIAFPERLEKQVSFLNKDPEVGILGSTCYIIDQHGQKRGEYQVPEHDFSIRWISLLGSPFLHPALMLRRSVLVQHNLNYDENFEPAEDYELWTQMLKYTRGANLKTPLLKYRLHNGSVTSTRRDIQLKKHDFIAWRTIQEQLPEIVLTPEQVTQLRQLFVGGESDSYLDSQRMPLIKLYLEMLNAFLSRQAGEPGWSELKRREMLKVVRVALRPPLQPGWLGLMRGVLVTEPGLPWFFLRALPLAMKYRLRLLTLYFSR